MSYLASLEGNLMKASNSIGLVVALALSACATPQPEVRMIPTGDHGVGVRFAQGHAAMVSNGPSGSVMLLPIRYNASDKLYFAVAAFNTSGRPINFGTEDVHIYLDNGAVLPVQDFDYLRHEAIRRAQREMANAWLAAGVAGYLAYQQAENHPRRHEIAYRRASGEFYLSTALIERNLMQEIASRGNVVLQTTTIDPGRKWGGGIFARQVVIPDGAVREMVVDVRFGGDSHLFRIGLAHSGAGATVPANIPAVPQVTMETLQRTRNTWLFTNGPEPTPYDDLEIIE